ncbi:MAG: immune inhibitor A domain-containing protein [Lutisporaceae bacterium]
MFKKLLVVLVAVAMIFGTTGVATAVDTTASVVEDQLAYNGNAYYQFGGPVDLNIANEDKVIEMLKKSGKINPNATYDEAQTALAKYMQERAKVNQKETSLEMVRNEKAKQNQKVQKYIFDNKTEDKNPKTVNVLVLLAEYADYAHNSITSDETDMYYDSFEIGHYEDMLFGDNGFVGPNGQNMISMKQYYQEQSGGSLIVEGTVAGWYTLPRDAAYYGANSLSTGNDLRPRNAVAHALQLAAQDPSINLADYDKEDLFDLDGDGDYNEPDGIIDYLMVVHAGLGEDEGGGALGEDAIWSHSWDLGGVYAIPGTTAEVGYWGGALGAYAYTIEAENGAPGVFVHEFGHNLGLPDEYDTQYTSASGEPISFWSIMSSGSWGGTIQGTEPSAFSPYAKQYFQAVYGGNWQNAINIDYDEISQAGVRVTLNQASESGQVVRVNLPEKAHVLTTPISGEYAYWGGKGHDGASILTNMTTNVDLTGNTAATFNFKTWYDIEAGWDYAYVEVREQGTEEWTCIEGNITTTDGVEGRDVIVPFGITGASVEWVDANFDLSAFAGKNIEIKIEYATDAYSFGAGIYVDDIQVIADGNVVVADNVEGESIFTLNGFEKNTGTVYAPQYYLVEWRNHNGVDKGLAHVPAAGGTTIEYNPGMVIWYVNDYYTDNWTGVHPGEMYLGIVDADQSNNMWVWDDSSLASFPASGRYQMNDAAFSKNTETTFAATYIIPGVGSRTVSDINLDKEHIFFDGEDYSNPELNTLGINLPNYGLKIQITQQENDNSGAEIIIKK